MVKEWAKEFNDRFEPITDEQKEFHRKRSERFLFVEDKDGNCTCPKCGTKLTLGKTKHKDEVVCPSCTNKLTVEHTWRASKYLEVIKWMVVPKVVTNKVLCLRYVMAYQNSTNPMIVYEAARLYIDENHVDPEYYCKGIHGWIRGKNPYFRLDTYLTPNRFECWYADMYEEGLFEELDKLDCFKYYSSKNSYDSTRIPSQLMYMVHAANLNEKLFKIGMTNIAEEHGDYFRYHHDRCIKYNRKETSLKKMLGLDQPRFNLLRQFPNLRFMLWLQEHPEINCQNMSEAKGDIGRYNYVTETAPKLGVSFNKLNKYIENVNYGEHRHYLENIEKLGYNLKDTYYSMPRNFRDADDRIADEYLERFDKKAFERNKKQDKLIKEISEGIRKMPNLVEFLNGSRGLLVYVPESTKDLRTEGQLQKNCIGTYVDRIAEKKTLVFFVRRLDDPTAPFVDFEYCNGEVVQCRYAGNENVEDTQILDFVNKFAEALKAA